MLAGGGRQRRAVSYPQGVSLVLSSSVFGEPGGSRGSPTGSHWGLPACCHHLVETPRPGLGWGQPLPCCCMLRWPPHGLLPRVAFGGDTFVPPMHVSAVPEAACPLQAPPGVPIKPPRPLLTLQSDQSSQGTATQQQQGATEAPKILLLHGRSWKSSRFGPVTAPLMLLRKLPSALRLCSSARGGGRAAGQGAHQIFGVPGCSGTAPAARGGTWAGREPEVAVFYTQSPSAWPARGARQRPHCPSSTPTHAGRWCSLGFLPQLRGFSRAGLERAKGVLNKHVG